ncbi:MAG: flagellar hook-basal body complex protein, partial [Deltaproteobacteria bacterium]|nr:flagellar hook-basal body complex protein [Deltaproteobacteria bacterium]
MRVESSLYSSMSGLLSNGIAISAVGDNIANFSTIGFKKQRTEFESLVSDSNVKLSVESAGNGVAVARVRNLFADGSVEMTSRELDFAIQGHGFFVVTDGVNQYLTRAGNFSVDKNGFLITADGLRVLGFTGANFDQLAPLNLKAPDSLPKASTNGKLIINLDATSPLSAGFPPNPNTFTDIAQASNFSTSIQIVNSLGDKKQITLYFAKTAVNTWEVRAYVDGTDVGQANSTPVLIGSATLQFDSSGVLISNPQFQMNINWVGANPQAFTLDLTGSTQFALGPYVKSYQQNGTGVRGEPLQLIVTEKGALRLLFGDGTTYDAGYLADGKPPSLDHLERISENLFRSTDA